MFSLALVAYIYLRGRLHPTRKLEAALAPLLSASIVSIVLVVIGIAISIVLLLSTKPVVSVPQIATNAVLEKIVDALNAQQKTQESIAEAVKARPAGGSPTTPALGEPFDKVRALILILASGIFCILLFVLGWKLFKWAGQLEVSQPVTAQWLRWAALIFKVMSALSGVGAGAATSIVLTNVSTVTQISINGEIKISGNPGGGPNCCAPAPPAKQIQKIYIQFPEPKDPPKQPAKKVTMDCGVPDGEGGSTMRVGPFPPDFGDPADLKPSDGVAYSIFETQTKPSARRVIDKLKENSRENLVGIMLTGSFDQRPLSLRAKKRHGENAGLAATRANWVKGLLLQEKFAASQIMSAVAGPVVQLHGPNGTSVTVSTEKKGEPDRAVQVCAVWEASR